MRWPSGPWCVFALSTGCAAPRAARFTVHSGETGASLWYRWRPTEKLYRAELPARARGAPRAACATALQAQPVCPRQKRCVDPLVGLAPRACACHPSHEERSLACKPAVPPREACRSKRTTACGRSERHLCARQTQPSKRLEVAALTLRATRKRSYKSLRAETLDSSCRAAASIVAQAALSTQSAQAAQCQLQPQRCDRLRKREMSGSIPPQLTADDARRVADVRRDVWTAGLRGAVAGVFIGSTGWLGARHLNVLPKAFRTPNHFSLATMGCGALVSFLSSLAAGKNSVQRIGDVFSRGAVKPDGAAARLGAAARAGERVHRGHRRAPPRPRARSQPRRRRGAARLRAEAARFLTYSCVSLFVQ